MKRINIASYVSNELFKLGFGKNNFEQQCRLLTYAMKKDLKPWCDTTKYLRALRFISASIISSLPLEIDAELLESPQNNLVDESLSAVYHTWISKGLDGTLPKLRQASDALRDGLDISSRRSLIYLVDATALLFSAPHLEEHIKKNVHNKFLQASIEAQIEILQGLSATIEFLHCAAAVIMEDRI